MKRTLILLAAAALSGCAHVTPHFSTTSYDPTAMEIIGPATGTASHYYLFGLGPIGGDRSFGIAAYDAAVKSVGADALVNVVADETTKMDFLFIFYHREVTVRGIAVRMRKK